MGKDFVVRCVELDGDVRQKGFEISDEEVTRRVGRRNDYIYEGFYTLEELADRIKELLDLIPKLVVLEDILPFVNEYEDFLHTDDEESLEKLRQEIVEMDTVGITEFKQPHIKIKPEFSVHINDAYDGTDIDDVKKAIFAYSYALSLCDDDVFIQYS